MPKRTMFAQQAVDFSDYFAMMLGAVVVNGEVPRKPTLAAPEGMSTGGGKQAVQHILLKPDAEGAPTITVGWVDRSKGMAQLRTYEYLVEQHRQRFGNRPFTLDSATYIQFFQKAQDFLNKEKIPVKVESAPMPASPAQAAAPAKSGPNWLVIGIILALLFVGAVTIGGGLIWYFLFR